MPHLWEQQPNEPDLWFVRFERFRLLGVARSLGAAYRQECQELQKTGSKDAPGGWREAAKTYHWVNRAAAWDKSQTRAAEATIVQARSQRVTAKLVQDDEWFDRQQKLRTKAYQWIEDYLFGRVVETRTTIKEEDDLEAGTIRTETVVTCPKAPPQWIIERFTGKSEHEKHLNVLYGLVKQILALEGESPELTQAKTLIQSAIEGLLLESGADEIRLMLLNSQSAN